MKHIHITLLAIVILSGCKGAEPLVPFNTSEFSRFDGNGKATIEGQAFAKTRGGDIKYPAGDAVYLVPVTTHTTDWITSRQYRQYLFGAGNALNFSPLDLQVRKYMKSSICDGEGRFTFEDLVPGPYFALSSIRWYVGDSSVPESAVLFGRVLAREDRTAKIIVR